MITSIFFMSLPIMAKLREKMDESGKEFFTKDEAIEMLMDSVIQFSKDIIKLSRR